MESRYYDPQLIWSLARQKCLAELERTGHHPGTMTQVDPRILIYADELDGALLVQHGKLYHDTDTSDQYFANTDDKIADFDGKIREVVIRFGRDSKAFAAYVNFIEWIKS